ncbi:MAG: hypothetical protein K6D98_06535, partial [Clostridiales bacterium]|nr:hypothetical protein [Clostridiales bacterium]
VFDSYSALLQDIFGYSLSLSNVLNEALAEFLADSAGNWASTMESKSVVETLPNGKVKKYEFTEEQIEKMLYIAKKAEGISATFDND